MYFMDWRKMHMLKMFYVIFMNLFRAPYMIPKMRYKAQHPEKYSIEDRYELAKHCVRLMKGTGMIRTKAFGTEKLPQEGGYMLYPNHQGKYDALGIVYTHKKPCSVVIDKDKSNTILVKEFIDLLEGKRLDKADARQALGIINEVAEEVKKGRRFILFPEGGYRFNNHNILGDFKVGCFKIALKSKAPIVPVALVDSYRVFNSYHLGPVTTQVHYLEPIYYEQYGKMRTTEIAALVKQKIQEKLDEVL